MGKGGVVRHERVRARRQVLRQLTDHRFGRRFLRAGRLSVELLCRKGGELQLERATFERMPKPQTMPKRSQATLTAQECTYLPCFEVATCLTKFCHPSFPNGKLVAEVTGMAEVIQKVITWEDYLQGEPRDLEFYEIEDGKVIVVGAPSGEHQWVVGSLYRLLHEFATKRDLGVVLLAPFDVVVQQDPVRTHQPDLLFLRKERGGTPEQIRQLKRLEIPPDIAIEVVSASEEETERLERKLKDYHRIGVPEVWLVYPEERAIEVLVRAEDGWRWHGLFFSKDKVRSTVLGEIDLAVGKIFE